MTASSKSASSLMTKNRILGTLKPTYSKTSLNPFCLSTTKRRLRVSGSIIPTKLSAAFTSVPFSPVASQNKWKWKTLKDKGTSTWSTLTFWMKRNQPNTKWFKRAATKKMNYLMRLTLIRAFPSKQRTSSGLTPIPWKRAPSLTARKPSSKVTISNPTGSPLRKKRTN